MKREIYGNIFYFKKICKIGGTEQFLYEIAKKYNKYDILILYDEASYYQLERLRKLVKCKKREKGKILKCEKLFLNFNIDCINEIEADEVYFVSHAIYQELGYKPPIEHDNIKKCIGVSKYSSKKLEEYSKILNKEIEITTSYNPLTLESVKRPKILLTASRLNDKTKGYERIIKLIEELDNYCKNNPDEHYLFLIFSDKKECNIDSKNVCFMQNRIDIRSYIKLADYVVQLSNDMETYCYTINESLGYEIPIITTPLSIVKELDINDEMKIELNFDLSNIKEVVKEIFKKEKVNFKYKIPKDNWSELLSKKKSNYKFEEMVQCVCLISYYDIELEKKIDKGKLLPELITRTRAEELMNHERGKLVDIITGSELIKNANDFVQKVGEIDD